MPPCDLILTRPEQFCFTEVSILVLVDAALRPDPLTGSVGIDESFNPCFSGCRPATSRRTRDGDNNIKVSILVLVDAALRLECDTASDLGTAEFQSLF